MSGIVLTDNSGHAIFVVDVENNAIVLRNKKNVDNVWIHADPANGGSGIDLRDQNGGTTVTIAADHNAVVLRNKKNVDNVWIHADPANGGSGIDLRDQNGRTTIQIDGDQGDIRLLNADCAEDFDVAAEGGVEPATVMVLNSSGQLEQSTQPYDKRVAGVVSGAGDLRPGLVLGRRQTQRDRAPISLVGTVCCMADATDAPIEVGDLLTTSATPGHAMKASDPARSFGAVIGKAMQPLASGRGLIRIIVALQ